MYRTYINIGISTEKRIEKRTFSFFIMSPPKDSFIELSDRKKYYTVNSRIIVRNWKLIFKSLEKCQLDQNILKFGRAREYIVQNLEFTLALNLIRLSYLIIQSFAYNHEFVLTILLVIFNDY